MTNAFGDDFIFQQDNARPHISKHTLAFLEENGVKILDGWPPYSPDLNIIEVIWAIMKKRVEITNPQTLAELKLTIHKVWDELSFSTINGLLRSIPRRMEYVRDHNGLTVSGHI